MGTSERDSEYGEPRRYPSGTPRRPSQAERLQDLRTAGLRDEFLPATTPQGIQISK